MSVQPSLRYYAERSIETRDLVGQVDALMLQMALDKVEGPCSQMVREHLSTGGKRLRARLALDAVTALGGDAQGAVPWAAACEFMHNASIVHDDVQDGDEVRRGAPALWTRWGVHQAINAGDLMLMLPTLAVESMDIDDGVKWRLSRCIAHHGAQTVRGQARELSLRGDVHMERDAYMRAAVGKTGGLFGMPVEGAALLCGRDAQEAARFAKPFELLGLLFQLQDDVIDLYGDKGRGHPGADLHEGKVSALVVAHAERRPEDRLWLASVLRTPRENMAPGIVDEVARRFRQSGALDDVLHQIRQLADEVRERAPRAEPQLAGVAEVLLTRVLAPIAPLLDPGNGS